MSGRTNYTGCPQKDAANHGKVAAIGPTKSNNGTPLCTAPGCTRSVQRRATGRRRIPAIGLRELHGAIWCWFCSRSCAGRTRGRECAANQLWVRNFGQDQEGRITALTRHRRQGVAEDLDTLRRYGVPRVIAEAVLDRVAVRFDHRGYNRAWHRFAPKAKVAS